MENEINEQESFELINRMIRSAKEEMEDDSFYYLLWGWLVFIASCSQYILLRMNVEGNYLGWMILMPVGGIVTMVYSYRMGKKQRVKTYIDVLMNYVLVAFAVSLFIVLFFQAKLQLGTFPMVMMVYGIWLFVSGAAIKFRPLVIGGMINWVLCIVALYFPVDIQLLLLAAAVLLGYIIPGHLLKNKFAVAKK